VPEYQVHFLDAFGRILRTIQIECEDDDRARAIVEERAGTDPMEVWQGERLVERYEPELGRALDM
jgi:hypothetical protein